MEMLTFNLILLRSPNKPNFRKVLKILNVHKELDPIVKAVLMIIVQNL